MATSIVFDPPCIKALLELCLKGREHKPNDHKNTNQWLVKWKDWSDESILDTVEKWKKAGCVSSEEQLRFTAYVIAYMEILHRAILGHNGKSNPLPQPFPYLGPIFTPPSIEYRTSLLQTSFAASNPFENIAIQRYSQQTSPLNNPHQFLIEPVHVISPIYYPHLNLDKCQVPGCTGIINKRGFTSTGPRSIYGISSNIKAIGLEYQCSLHGIFSTMSCDKFWNYLQPWQCGNVPHFQERSGCTRELFDLITEVKPRLSVGELTENLRQLHQQHDRRLESSWLATAIFEKEKFPNREVKLFPTSILNSSTGVSKKLNPAPSETFVRDVGEYFIDKQRREESSQYMRGLTGCSIGLDTTFKVAKKANIYIKTTDGRDDSDLDPKQKMKVINIFDGGLLTGVNEDRELVICEFLTSNAYEEMNPPLLDFAERCSILGIPFQNKGKITVDRCCDMRKTLQIAFPNITIHQDLAHLKNRIMESVPKKSPYRNVVSKDISDALISQYSKKKGEPLVYRLKEEQALQLRRVWQKYCNIGGIWTAESETAFWNQVKHIENGCLQNDDPTRPVTTSINENWHRRINRLSMGRAGSLTMIEGLLMDAILRYNLAIELDNRSQSFNSPSRLFRLQTEGSHHLYLLNYILRQRERLTGISQPCFINIKPQHQFGLVPRGSNAASLQYLQQISISKEESSPELSMDSEEEIILTIPDETDLLCQSSQAGYQHSSPTSETGVPILDSGEQINNTMTSSPDIKFSHILPPSSPITTLAQSSPAIFPVAAANEKEIEDDTLELALNDFTVITEQESVSVPLSDNLSSTSSTSFPTSLPFLTVPSSMPSSSILAMPKQTRTSNTYFKRTGKNIMLQLKDEEFVDDAYWRFCAFRMQYRWISTMSDNEWVQACAYYNESSTLISPIYYRTTVPKDPTHREPISLKRFCIKFEERCRKWKADMDSGKDLTEWKKMHLGLPLPPRASTKSKQGRISNVKICSRCCQQKDGLGAENHPRDCCRDGFPVWKRVPYPLPADLATLIKGRTVICQDSCVNKFRELVKELEILNGDHTRLDQRMRNLSVFEKLARRDQYASLQQATSAGKEGYHFERRYFM